MKVSCMLLGCLWSKPQECRLGQELLLLCSCSRCGSQRYLRSGSQDSTN